MELANRIELGSKVRRQSKGWVRGPSCVRGSQTSQAGTQDLSSCMILGQHTRNWGPCPLSAMEGSLWDPSLAPPPLSQVRSGDG